MTDAIVLDIEGTTSSLRYVHDTLFPYSRDRIAEWIARPEAAVAAAVTEVRESEGRPGATLDEVAAILRDWIDRDVKAPPLKSLQGLIWEAGFAAGDLVAQVYDDVPVALETWRDQGIRLFVYSSGSVLAQRLWFRHTGFGDLSGYFSGHFDTRNAGPKRETESYKKIARAVRAEPRRLLFASDTPGELDAAQAAGWSTVQVLRPGDGATATAAHGQVTGFDQLPQHTFFTR